MDERPARLSAYRAKRDPERTPEPFGGRRPAGRRLFVVQQHAARRLHYDVRLEMDGVLKSWAVPKGPPARDADKRLAVHVEDHPLEYADFEGVIPAGNYGAGAVIVWDRGWYRPVKDEDPLAALARGALEVELFGYKMRGRWTLARMSGAGKDWLLLRKTTASADAVDLVERYPRSVVSGLTVEDMRDVAGRRAAMRARLLRLGAPARLVSPGKEPFMLATPAETPFSRAGWLFEIKYDGVRVLAIRRGDAVILLGRTGRPVTGRYPEIVAALRALPVDDFVVDGEIVALDAAGRPSFQRLQARMALTSPRDVERAAVAVPVSGVFFDCLALEGHDLRRLTLLERKEGLAWLLPPVGPVRYGDHVLTAGQEVFGAAEAAGLEGIVAKKADAVYEAGRSRNWIKIKCQRRQEFVIGGFTDPKGSRARFGALHVGCYDAGRLVYASKVGTGFDDAAIERLWAALGPLRRETSPFVGGPAGSGHHWVEPRLVCEVRFTEWTADGGLRHPAFLGLRSDKRPEECRRETVSPPPIEGEEPLLDEGRAARPRADDPAPPAPIPDAPAPGERVRITNPDKVFWPAERYSKGDLIAYYRAIAPLLVPYLRERPLVLTRYPDGIEGKSFFQKDAPDFVPAWVRTERIYSKDAEREIDYFVVDDVDTLVYVINMGTIPLHLWASRLDSLERPDWLVLDLDPKGAPFADVVRVARTLHRILDGLELPSYVKTSGATGLHILVPLGARYLYEDARTFARLLALLAVQAEPGISTVARPIHARGGKVYVDFGQNGHGRTIVAPYSARPLPGAPASCPLRWSEVNARLDPGRFTIATVPRRFEKMADPLAPVLSEAIDMAAAIRRIEERVGRAR